ncbi:MAG TPA: Stp1/IreP family PP2C-type Ser/Thr phosphatase [Methylophilaceae bacterium]|nr:Stp1/IreP family PP2C-type Ser/Thr phosphatase [Methylophilaceae bacterium]
MNLMDTLQIVRLTDVGLKRDHNEDAIASDAEIGLVVLADGMGGYKAGEVASEIAVLTIVAELKEAMLELEPGHLDPVTEMQAESLLVLDAVKKANESIYYVSQNEPQCAGMGTTLVMGLFTNNRLLVGHIGDSRMYRLRDDELQKLTQDHSLLQEQINSGLITPEQAKTSTNKNLVTRALGVDPDVELELDEFDVEVGDIYLLCSDGLTDMVEDEVIHTTLKSLHTNLELAANHLIQLANDNGGSDNVSVILVRILKPFAAERGWYDNLLNWLK